jgi:hypothetical protein
MSEYVSMREKVRGESVSIMVSNREGEGGRATRRLQEVKEMNNCRTNTWRGAYLVASDNVFNYIFNFEIKGGLVQVHLVLAENNLLYDARDETGARRRARLSLKRGPYE